MVVPAEVGGRSTVLRWAREVRRERFVRIHRIRSRGRQSCCWEPKSGMVERRKVW